MKNVFRHTLELDCGDAVHYKMKCLFFADVSSNCPALPVPNHGAVDCSRTSYGLSCLLTCDDDYHFASTYDPSPQTCVEGIWQYERERQTIPDCEGLLYTVQFAKTFTTERLK